MCEYSPRVTASTERKRKRLPDAEARAAAAAVRLAASRGWLQIGFRDIAEEAELSLEELHVVATSKPTLLRAFARSIDAAMLASYAAGKEEGESPRDRLFAVTMARLDALAPHRDGVAAIVRAALCDLPTACALTATLNRSLTWMLEAVGLGSSGFAGALRRRGLALILASTLRVWLRDTSEDLGPTMAHLDRQLRRAEWLAGMVFSGKGRRTDAVEA